MKRPLRYLRRRLAAHVPTLGVLLASAALTQVWPSTPPAAAPDVTPAPPRIVFVPSAQTQFDPTAVALPAEPLHLGEGADIAGLMRIELPEIARTPPAFLERQPPTPRNLDVGDPQPLTDRARRAIGPFRPHLVAAPLFTNAPPPAAALTLRFSGGLDGRTVAQVDWPAALTNAGRAAWSAGCELLVAADGRVDHVFIDDAPGDPAVGGALLSALGRARLSPAPAQARGTLSIEFTGAAPAPTPPKP